MSINQRVADLEKFYKSKGITFNKFIGVNSQTIKNITGERQSNPSHKILESILNADSKININWLILGQGKMWLDENELLKDEEIKLLKARMEELENKFDELKPAIKEQSELIKEISKDFGDMNIEEIVRGIIEKK